MLLQILKNLQKKTSSFDTETNVGFYLKIEKNHKSIMKRMMMTSFGFIFRCRYSFSWLDRSSVLLTLWLKVVAKKYFKCSGSIVPFKLIGFTKNVDDKREKCQSLWNLSINEWFIIFYSRISRFPSLLENIFIWLRIMF